MIVDTMFSWKGVAQFRVKLWGLIGVVIQHKCLGGHFFIHIDLFHHYGLMKAIS